MEKKFLYTGTTSALLDLKKGDFFYYEKYDNSTGLFTTSVSEQLAKAMWRGEHFNGKARMSDYDRIIRDPKPVLMAVDASKYTPYKNSGMEFGELRISDPIYFRDIVIVNDFFKLALVCPKAENADIDSFRKSFIRTSDN